MVDYKEQGNEQFKARNYPVALELYTKAIEVEPNNHIFYSNRAACYMKMDKFQEALEDSEKCIQINHTFAKGYQRKGSALGKLEKFWESFVSYSKGSLYDPSNQNIKDE